MIKIEEKHSCSGCTACANICPKHAIQMLPDEEGFLYPTVDSEKCVNCGLCDGICPVRNPIPAAPFERTGYAIRAKQPEIVKRSTSGGFITPLARWVLSEGGVVFGAVYDDSFRVVHRCVSREEDIPTLRGSKYVQSDLSSCFPEIRRYLEQGTRVCFVGTPCQVYGLRAFLKQDYINLILVDLVCFGVPSPKLWEKYLEYQKNRFGSEITEVVFRNKTYGYHGTTMKLCFQNGRTYFGSARVDPMLKSFFGSISSRPSCYDCSFKTMERCSDFTIFDCWHISRLVPGLKDDDRGFTNLIVQSDKGAAVLESIRGGYEFHPIDARQALALDGITAVKSIPAHLRRNEYYRNLDEHTLDAHIAEFLPVSAMDHLIEWSKKGFYRMGVFQTLKRLKK